MTLIFQSLFLRKSKIPPCLQGKTALIINRTQISDELTPVLKPTGIEIHTAHSMLDVVNLPDRVRLDVLFLSNLDARHLIYLREKVRFKHLPVIIIGQEHFPWWNIRARRLYKLHKAQGYLPTPIISIDLYSKLKTLIP